MSEFFHDILSLGLIVSGALIIRYGYRLSGFYYLSGVLMGFVILVVGLAYFVEFVHIFVR